jgi:endonuclease-3
MNRAMNKKEQVYNIFKTLQKLNPKPTTELNYTSDFELLVAVVLSAQATDVGVNKALAKLYPVANTPQSILALGIEGLEAYIKTIGLYRAKAKNIIALCEMLIKDYNSAVPNTFAELVKLPGVGRKTANVILNTLFGHKTIAVDTHVFRVSNRLGIETGITPDAVEKKLMKVVPIEFQQDAHHWLILHGRYVCKARKPECEKCSLTEYCKFFMTNKVKT